MGPSAPPSAEGREPAARRAQELSPPRKVSGKREQREFVFRQMRPSEPSVLPWLPACACARCAWWDPCSCCRAPVPAAALRSGQASVACQGSGGAAGAGQA
uniref:Uncharacterized protein n=1 Tax=Tetraselmis sp. GSL018 TaxID=582737 RepID=A0A061R1H0_9CHLO